MLTKDTFKNLVIAIRDHGNYDEREIDGELYRVYVVNDLQLVLVRFKNAWKPEGVSFTLFNNSFFIAPGGNITITEDEDDPTAGESDIYSLSDEELISVVSSFIKWRLSVMMKLGI